MSSIADMIIKINSRIQSFSRDYQPKYVKDNKWLEYNKGRFNLDDYVNASESRKEVIARDIERSYNYMPTKAELKQAKDNFINNFNKAANSLGLGNIINNRNYKEFKDFVNYYNENVENYKYTTSDIIVRRFNEYMKTKNKYGSIKDFYELSGLFI